MNLVQFFMARLKSSLRDFHALVFIVIAVAVAVAAAVTTQTQTDTRMTVAVVSEDTGGLGARLISVLENNESFSMRQLNEETALKELRQDRVEAVVIISPGFSDTLQRGEFRNTLELYTSPSSQAAATVTEPLINGVMMLWMEELSTLRTQEFLIGQGKLYSAADEAAQRAEIRTLWQNGANLLIDHVTLDTPESGGASSGAFAACMRWYAVFCLFYLVVGASWVLDLSKKKLGARVTQTGTRRWKVVLTSSLPPLLLCLAGYVAAGVFSCLVTGAPILNVLSALAPVAVYLCALTGMTLLLASLCGNVLILMFLAPILTFLHGVLSGLLLTLPKWAYMLTWLSRILPGRWLSQTLDDSSGALPFALLCAALWLLAGIAVSAGVQKKAQER